MSVLILVIALASVVACHWLAQRRGKDPMFWSVMGALFGPFAVPFIFVSKAKTRD